MGYFSPKNSTVFYSPKRPHFWGQNRSFGFRVQSKVDQSILIYVVITSFHFERRLHNIGAVCSEEKTEIKLKGQDTTPSSTYLDVFTADRVSDLLANSFWLEFKNFKIVKEETKNGRENTDMNREPSTWIELIFDWSFWVEGCDCVATP